MWLQSARSSHFPARQNCERNTCFSILTRRWKSMHYFWGFSGMPFKINADFFMRIFRNVNADTPSRSDGFSPSAPGEVVLMKIFCPIAFQFSPKYSNSSWLVISEEQNFLSLLPIVWVRLWSKVFIPNSMSMCGYIHVHTTRTRGRCQIPRSWSYRWLWATWHECWEPHGPLWEQQIFLSVIYTASHSIFFSFCIITLDLGRPKSSFFTHCHTTVVSLIKIQKEKESSQPLTFTGDRDQPAVS